MLSTVDLVRGLDEAVAAALNAGKLIVDGSHRYNKLFGFLAEQDGQNLSLST